MILSTKLAKAMTSIATPTISCPVLISIVDITSYDGGIADTLLGVTAAVEATVTRVGEGGKHNRRARQFHGGVVGADRRSQCAAVRQG